MQDIKGYARIDGLIKIVDLWTDDGGRIYRGFEKLEPTGGRAKLRGWPDEGTYPVYAIESGIEGYRDLLLA